MKVAICTPVHSHATYDYLTSLAGLLIFTGEKRPDIELKYVSQRGTGIDRNRRMIAESALAGGAEWLLWIDADQSFPCETLIRLLSHNQPIVGCNVARRADDQPPTAKTAGGRPLNGGTGTEKVISTGFGVMLVSADVFAKMRKPWFVWSEQLGEDERFCHRAREMGLNILVDHDLSSHIGHVGEKIYRLE